jgi:hypothetical protein
VRDGMPHRGIPAPRSQVTKFYGAPSAARRLPAPFPMRSSLSSRRTAPAWSSAPAWPCSLSILPYSSSWDS